MSTNTSKKGAESPLSPSQVIERLEVLWHKLEDEGLYVRANTAALAIQTIKQLTENK